MKEIEEKLKDLQGQHSALTESYKTLQLEYSAMKHELETLRRKQASGSSTERSYVSGLREWDSSRSESSDPLLFDVSAFCYEPDDGERKGPRD
jgi:AP-1-like transcription factor